MRGEDVYSSAHEKRNQSLPRGGLAELNLGAKHPFYVSWVNMKTRCENPNSTQYPWYGGRGISYCERWKKFWNFYEDMFAEWGSGLTLDRIDPEGNYEPDNCRWIPQAAQAKNRRPRSA